MLNAHPLLVKLNTPSAFNARVTQKLLTAAAALTAAVLLTTTAPTAHATVLPGPERFVAAVSINDDGSVLVGSSYETVSGIPNAGAVYYYGAGATSATPRAPDSSITNALFGTSVSLSGNSALVGAPRYSSGGAVFYISDLAANSAPVALSTLSVGAADRFGDSVSLSGTRALVGAPLVGAGIGAVYYYANLSQTPTRIEEPDVGDNAQFGYSVSLSGTRGLVSAPHQTIDGNDAAGAVYYYSNLDGNGSPVQLTATEPFAYSYFGSSLSLSGNKALIGANPEAGGVYYYSNLDAPGGGTPVLLTTPTHNGDILFGASVSLSGTKALVGAPDSEEGTSNNVVYYYSNLEAAEPITPAIGFFASGEPEQTARFGASVSFAGNYFATGVTSDTGGKTYVGDIRAFTTLDAGDTHLSTGGLSAEISEDWIIGKTTSNNSVTVSKSDGVSDSIVLADWSPVYIGKEAGANGNKLIVEGKLTGTIIVGADGNTGNELVLEASTELGTVDINLYAGNLLRIAEYLFGKSAADVEIGDLLSLTGMSYLRVGETTVSAGNPEASGLVLTPDSVSGYVVVSVASVPEPSTYALFGGLGAVALALLRRRRKSK